MPPPSPSLSHLSSCSDNGHVRKVIKPQSSEGGFIAEQYLKLPTAVLLSLCVTAGAWVAAELSYKAGRHHRRAYPHPPTPPHPHPRAAATKDFSRSHGGMVVPVPVGWLSASRGPRRGESVPEALPLLQKAWGGGVAPSSLSPVPSIPIGLRERHPRPAPCCQAQLTPSPTLLFLKGSLVTTRGPHQERFVVEGRPALGAGELPLQTRPAS